MANPPAVRSVTRILGLGLTPGKLRGLQSISNPDGTLTMVALDQNSSMIDMAKKSLGREPTYSEIVDAKVHLADALAPHASALLVDAYYGAMNTVATFSLPKSTGLLVRVEKSGGGKNAVGAPLTAVEPGWGVAKIKRMGADAVKVLAPFEPTELDSAEHQVTFLQQIYDECQRHDILMLLEPVAFPFGAEVKEKEPKKTASFRARQPETCIESARILSRLCDVYKAEFPGFLDAGDENVWTKNLKRLDEVCEKPWVLLSAGVDFPAYKKQVELAMRCGASGVLGGRAFWKEYFAKATFEERDQFARGECVNRVKQIDELVHTGTPWFQRYGLDLAALKQMRTAEGWHQRYGGRGAGGTSAGYVEGETY